MMVNSGKACLAAESFLGLDMTIPTEPIGSIPRPQKVITAFEQYERMRLRARKAVHARTEVTRFALTDIDRGAECFATIRR
jgi:hypothetical protein